MAKIAVFCILLFLPVCVFPYSSYNISEVFAEVDLGYETYYAEIDHGIWFGQVTTLYKKVSILDIGFDRYIVKVKWIDDGFVKIEGTNYVLKLQFAYSFDFIGNNDWVLDTTKGLSGTLTKR